MKNPLSYVARRLRLKGQGARGAGSSGPGARGSERREGNEEESTEREAGGRGRRIGKGAARKTSSKDI